MTKHDTWAILKLNSPLSEIIELFTDGQIPMRDPFPMGLAINKEGEKAAFYCIDLERLKSNQASEIIKIYARELNIDIYSIFLDALSQGGFGINSEYIERLFCGPEGYQRTKEINDFYQRHPNPTTEQIDNFMKDQCRRWIKGDEEPPPLPGHIEGFDPRLITPKLKEALKQQEIEKELANYSVFDVLTGRAMVNILNKKYLEHQVELVDLEELLDD